MDLINKVKIEFPAHPQNVALARSLVAALVAEADPTLSELDELKVAVSEAVTNAVIHAYPENPQGLIELTACLESSRVTILIRDWGQGIADLPKALEADYSTQQERMGLGFSLMQAFSTEMEVKSESGQGTWVKLHKDLAKPENLPEI
ncbi:MAG: anti-sigma F factor [Clostridia bacterium]|nr:anti-sigma F factor [Clostridia bacterium]